MKATSWLQGIALGAGIMYLFDPERGTRRRNLLRDQTTHQLNVKKKSLKVMQRDFKNRSQGVIHNLQGRFQTETAEDVILVERVRSAMGRCCSHTHGIQVSVNNGEVTLDGPVMANEITELVGTVRNVRGVTRVINNLEMHNSAEGVAGLQGGSLKTTTSRLSPGECLVAVCAGTVLSIYGLGRRGVFGWLSGVAGITLIAKGFSDTEHRVDGATSTPSGQGTHTEIPRANVAQG